MPNLTPDPDANEWVLASAAEVERNVARHGVPITWSEAVDRLRRTVELLSEPVFLDDGGTFTPLCQQETPRWQEVGFAESVACAAVHFAGQPYYPENPKSSRVELAIPWDTATALVHLLSALLVARLTGPTPSCSQEQVEAAQLLSRLSADVAFEFSRQDEELLCDEARVGERVYLLMRSCDVWQHWTSLATGGKRFGSPAKRTWTAWTSPSGRSAVG